jgi:recombination protein RecR
MNTTQKLIEYFSEFPGIGPRQARRFVYYLLTRSDSNIQEFIHLMSNLKSTVKICNSCYRFFQSDNPNISRCEICQNPQRNEPVLTIVSRDVDLENIEKAHVFNGKYFVLGGSVPILEKNPEQRIRSKELLRTVEERAKKQEVKEIILAVNATPEGENTADYIESILRPLTEQYALKISHLGRGISTGTELEYSDAETIKNALRNRQ